MKSHNRNINVDCFLLPSTCSFFQLKDMSLFVNNCCCSVVLRCLLGLQQGSFSQTSDWKGKKLFALPIIDNHGLRFKGSNFKGKKILLLCSLTRIFVLHLHFVSVSSTVYLKYLFFWSFFHNFYMHKKDIVYRFSRKACLAVDHCLIRPFLLSGSKRTFIFSRNILDICERFELIITSFF